ncbi:3-keto-disaccharide hydrolase [Rhodopirellula bahusiensis]|uniref:3-keto-disaccharide hydrolase n=2 Tax=Rhodopirellula bahusiensis TaxID=2014065 RepID=UPI0032641F1B
MRKHVAVAILAGLWTSIAMTASAAEVEEGFVSLFNGNDLSGWVKRGGSAKYHVEDGAIVGECVPNTPGNTFMCSEQEFGDFVLKLQYKFIEAGNSGVQFRSASRPEGDRERVFGYQAEMRPGGDMTGRIYDEGRRGHKHGIIWLDAHTSEERLSAAQASCRQGEWNDLEIQCVGPSIKTWLNGHLVVDMFDSFSMKGFLGLQIHGGKSGSVAWKNIRIKDLGESQWKSFFAKGDDGSYQLQDAKFVLPEEWSFTEEGVLHGVHSKSQGKDGLVISNDNYDDFIARVTYRMQGGNSALYFRAEETSAPWVLRGFQNEIANNGKDSALWHTAGIIDGKKIPGRGWIVTNDELVEKVRNKDGGWNTTCTAAYGDRLVQTLNGFCTSDIIDEECEKTGKLGLQMHGGTDCEMFFKDFEVMPVTEDIKKLIDRK